jgi:hypothetical protein
MLDIQLPWQLVENLTELKTPGHVARNLSSEYNEYISTHLSHNRHCLSTEAISKKLCDKEKEYSCKVFFEHKTRRNDREMYLLNLSMEHLVFVCCSCTPFCPAQLSFFLLQCPSFDLAFPVCGGPGGSRVLLRSGLPRMLQLWCQILHKRPLQLLQQSSQTTLFTKYTT